MSLFQAILLGIVQGATEFLPVSSSGHLFLIQRFLGISEPELAFDLLLHLGTLFAVLFFLRAEISEILVSIFRREHFGEKRRWGRRELGLVILSTIPTGVIGMAFHDVVEKEITIQGVGIRYLVLTTLLLVSNLRLRHKWEPERIEVWEALLIGVVQGAAVFPGLSRSGSTISLALLLGIAPSRSAKYSFLISLPAILGAAAVNLKKGVSVLPPAPVSAAGFFFSLLVGYAALYFVERLVTRGKFVRFAPYTFLLAAICLYFGWRG